MSEPYLVAPKKVRYKKYSQNWIQRLWKPMSWLPLQLFFTLFPPLLELATCLDYWSYLRKEKLVFFSLRKDNIVSFISYVKGFIPLFQEENPFLFLGGEVRKTISSLFAVKKTCLCSPWKQVKRNLLKKWPCFFWECNVLSH